MAKYKKGDILYDKKVKEYFEYSLKWELAIQLDNCKFYTESRYRLAEGIERNNFLRQSKQN